MKQTMLDLDNRSYTELKKVAMDREVNGGTFHFAPIYELKKA